MDITAIDVPLVFSECRGSRNIVSVPMLWRFSSSVANRERGFIGSTFSVLSPTHCNSCSIQFVAESFK